MLCRSNRGWLQKEKKKEGFDLTSSGTVTEETKKKANSALYKETEDTVNVSNNTLENEQRIAQVFLIDVVYFQDTYTREEIVKIKKRVTKRRHIRKQVQNRFFFFRAQESELAPLPEHMETEEDKRSRNDENQQSILTSQLEEMRGKKENYKRAALKEEERIKRLRISEV